MRKSCRGLTQIIKIINSDLIARRLSDLQDYMELYDFNIKYSCLLSISFSTKATNCLVTFASEETISDADEFCSHNLVAKMIVKFK